MNVRPGFLEFVVQGWTIYPYLPFCLDMLVSAR